MRCNGLPNAFDPADLRKYLHIWCEGIRLYNEREQNWLLCANEQSILTQDVNVPNMSRESLKQQQPEIGNVYAAKTREVLGILEEIDDALHDTDMTQSMIDDLHEVHNLSELANMPPCEERVLGMNHKWELCTYSAMRTAISSYYWNSGSVATVCWIYGSAGGI